MNHDPFHWGRPSDATYGPYNHQIAHASNVNPMARQQQQSDFPTMHTQRPMMTGTSVLAIKYQDGIVIAADNMGSYGSLMKLDNVERLLKVGQSTIVGISGDLSDLQAIQRILNDLEIDEAYDAGDDEDTIAAGLKANHVHEYLTRILYNRRSKMDPLWNACVVAGFDDEGKSFLKYVDLLGVAFASPTLATGFGAHLAIPLLRQRVDSEADVKNLTKADAIQLIKDCMKVLFYRDARSLDKYSMAVLSESDHKVEFHKNVKVEDMKWGFAKGIKGYGMPQL
ncbi:unnamed protein product [Ambrosiozyma monospora]|uniref:Proteasome subunit beta n=1 Tax=Ambrosiozyma monospora TaxID=43982 RepID=A0A9W6Z771_AMBMO|nr:unnamed protein product [Ambrosiozyma monospora]